MCQCRVCNRFVSYALLFIFPRLGCVEIMINAQALTKTLQQAIGNGVDTVLLLSTKGIELSVASSIPEYASSTQHSLLVATIANLWRAYATNDLAKSRSGTIDPESLEALLVDLGESKICAVGVGSAGIVAVVGGQVEMGMLKLKATSLQRHLDGPLRNVLQ